MGNLHFNFIAIKRFLILPVTVLMFFLFLAEAAGQTMGDVTGLTIENNTLILESGRDKLEIEAIGEHVLRVNFQPDGIEDPNTLVISTENWVNIPASIDTSGSPIVYQFNGNRLEIERSPVRIKGFSHRGGEVFWQSLNTSFNRDGMELTTSSQNFYGIDNRQEGSLTTNSGAAISAGSQGGAGAPFLWSPDGWGMVADANGGEISISGGKLGFRQGSATAKNDIEVFFLFGPPKTIFKGLTLVSGKAPLLPAFSYGFLNTEWGMDEQELRNDVQRYRDKNIPLDAYILDFDWIRWGEDNYGEFRWGDKFPSGSSGRLKKDMETKGVKIMGIRKPRIHTGTVQGDEAESLGLFYDKQIDFFSGKEVGRLNFNLPEAREWYWNTFINKGAGFENGVIGYWNDEADEYGGNFMFMQMQRSQYEGQRQLNDQRVWSINRNFYLGAQRFSYAMWSGDIGTGFSSMAQQRLFMLTSTNLGAPWWGMDIGGFNGTPSPENYFRWIQFGTFVPVFRVHGTQFEEREPWNFGMEAETIAKKYIRLRYRLLPYIYTAARQLYDTGVPMVRPLIMEYPDDPNVKNRFDGWHFGDDILVYPVVQAGQQEKNIYLPEGNWIDFHTGQTLRGPATVTVEVRKEDIPLFVKAGAVLPGAPIGDYVDDPKTQYVRYLFAFGPGQGRSTLYEDDGITFDFEQNITTRTQFSLNQTTNRAELNITPIQRTFKVPERDYIADFKYTTPPDSVVLDGQLLSELVVDSLTQYSGTGWSFDSSLQSTLVRFKDNGNAHNLKVFFGIDDMPPAVDSVLVQSDSTLKIHFSEPVVMDESAKSALNSNNYDFDKGVQVRRIESSFDFRTVTLVTTIQERGQTQTLSISNIADRSEQANLILPFEFTYTVPTVFDLILQDGFQGYHGTADAHIAEFLPQNNMGGNPTFEAARFDGSNNQDDKSMLIRFELSDVEINDTTLIKADLVLTLAETRNGSTDKNLGAFRLLKKWNQGDNTGIDGSTASTGEVTWTSGRHNIEPWENPGGDMAENPVDVITINNQAGSSFSWDITSLVRFWNDNPAENFGILLKEPQSSTENGTKVFFASESETQSARPKLVLTFDESSTATNVLEEETELPREFKLEQNYPNPFNPTTTITYKLPRASTVNLVIYNYLGQKVMQLMQNRQQSAGLHTIRVDASELASGLYIYRLDAGNFTDAKKMMLVK